MTITQTFPPVRLISAEWIEFATNPGPECRTGVPGRVRLVSVNARDRKRVVDYRLTVLGTLDTVTGYRFQSLDAEGVPRGELRDVELLPGGQLRCDCPDHLARQRPGGCRHCVALRLLGEVEAEEDEAA